MKKIIFFLLIIICAAFGGLSGYLLMILKILPNEGPVHGELVRMAGVFLFLLLIGILLFNFPAIILLRKLFHPPALFIIGLVINWLLIILPYTLILVVDDKRINLFSDESVSINAPLLLASFIFTTGWYFYFARSASKNSAR